MTIRKQIKSFLKGENLSNTRETSVKKGDKVTKRSENIFSRFYSDLASSLAFWTGEKDLESEAVYIKPNNQLSPQVQSNLHEIQLNGKYELRMFGNHEVFNPSGTYSQKNYYNTQRNSIPFPEVYSRGV